MFKEIKDQKHLLYYQLLLGTGKSMVNDASSCTKFNNKKNLIGTF